MFICCQDTKDITFLFISLLPGCEYDITITNKMLAWLSINRTNHLMALATYKYRKTFYDPDYQVCDSQISLSLYCILKRFSVVNLS